MVWWIVGINVLDLFSGIACGRLALERAGIKVENYYASEIDKYAIQIAKKNFPDIIELGDINDWQSWDLPKIDLIMGGSPCQGFSRAGEGLNFNDPRSKLFFVFVDIVKHYNPKYFLLENVKMKQEWQDVISNYLGVKPVLINSALVSAQNRERLYWANFPIQQPEDKGILLKDIVFNDVFPIALHNIYGGFKEENMRIFENKSPTIRTARGGGHIPSLLQTKKYWLSKKEKDYMDREVADGRTHWDFAHHSDTWDEKSSAVVANFLKGVPYNVLINRNVSYCGSFWDCDFSGFDDEFCKDCDKGDNFQMENYPPPTVRKFHPVECERLQTIPDNYTDGVSNTQRYKMIGNAWTVDVITHILKQIKD